jgi:hypothetical protein
MRSTRGPARALSPWRPLLCSTVAFALALLLMITLHELAHAVAGLAMGLDPVMRPFSVDAGGVTPAQRAITAAAGPLFSLVSGLAVLALPQSGTPFGRLFALWFALLSVQEFNGYLIIGPFVADGDIGIVLRETGSQVWVAGIGLVVGVAGTVWAGRVATARLLTMVDPAGDAGPQLRRLGLFAWLLGALLAILLSIGQFEGGGTGLFEVAGAVTVGLFLLFVRYFMRRLDVPGQTLYFSWPWAGAGFLLIVAVLRQIALAGGLTF